MKARLKKGLSGILTLALLLGLMPALTPAASAAAPSSENFETRTANRDGETVNSYNPLPLAIGNWTFGILDAAGNMRASAGLSTDSYYIDIATNDSVSAIIKDTGNKALLVQGYGGTDRYLQAKSTSGNEFKLVSFRYEEYYNPTNTIRVIGYRDGAAVLGAVQDLSTAQGTVSNVTFSGSEWNNIDEFRIASISGGNLTDDINFYLDDIVVASPPTITSVSPTSGSTTGGTSVTITGTGFTGATAVKFGSTSASSYTISSDTQITATAPAGSGTVDVTVTTSAGTSATSAADQFTYTAPNTAPTLTASAANPPFTENGSAVSLFSGASVSAGEGGQTITELKLTVGGLADGASEILRADGTAIALTNGNSGTTTTNTMTYAVSVSGGMATITLSKSGGISAAAMQALIDGIAYQNTSNAPTGANRTVTITSIKDSGGTANGGVDTTTLSIASTVTIIAVNDAPTDISLSPNVVNQSTGANAEVGTLSAADPDTGDTFTYTLVSGTGDTNNASFNISGSILYANNASAMTAGAYSVRIRVSDGSLTYEKALTVTVIDNVAPAAPIIASAITVTNSPTPTLEGIAEANSTVKMYDTDGTTVLGTATANGSGSWSIVSSSLSDGAHTITAKAVDGAGNTSAASSGRAITIDTTAPTSAIVVTPAALRVGETATVTFIFSEAVIGFTNADLTVPNGTLSAVSSTDGGITWTATFTPTANVEAVSNIITLANSGFADMAGNTGTGTTTSNNYSIDAVAPTVISVVPPVNGTYTAGQALNLIVVFIEPVTVTGTPRIAVTLDTGGTVYAGYLSGSGTSMLTFQLTVSAGQADSDGITVGALDLNGGTIRNTAGNDATLTLNGVGSTTAVFVDAVAPTLTGAVRTDDTHITVTLSEACRNLVKANDGGFVVTKTGAAETFAISATAQGADSAHVVLTVADLSSAGTAGVTVTYAPGTNGTISDLVGIALAADSTGKAIPAWTAPYTGGSSGSSNNGAAVIVNGQSQTAGTTATSTNAAGQTVTTVTVDTAKLENILAAQGDGATVIIPVTGGSDAAAATLTGAMLRSMEDKGATLVLQTASGSYTLPTSEIDMGNVAQQLGSSSLADIAVTVSISEPSAVMAQLVENAARDGGFTLMVPAVDYTITCTYGGQSVTVDSFNSYVERTIAIPDGVDPARITTGVVVDPDGTVHHVPTRITLVGSKYYAVINSLTNSTYSVIWNPVTFSDVASHWARDAINDMGSRMIVTGVGEGSYAPARSMTRAEFAAIVVRALGLEPGTGESRFGDVASTAWYGGYVKTAAAYGIITGYGDGSFGPNDNITREQAMTMLSRAMAITGLDARLSGSAGDELLSAFTDAASVSTFAKNAVAACLKTGVSNGTSAVTLSPQADISRAEVAVMVKRLLEKSGLI